MRIKTTFLFTIKWIPAGIITLLIVTLCALTAIKCTKGNIAKSIDPENRIAESDGNMHLKFGATPDQVKDPDASPRWKYHEAGSYCAKWQQSWHVIYYIYRNQVHTNGYVVISEVTIQQHKPAGEDYVMTFQFDNSPSNYIHSIHEDLKFLYGPDKHSFQEDERGESCWDWKPKWAFQVLRTAEDIVRACEDIENNNSPWSAVLRAAERQQGRKHGIALK